jgi:hypothetical protein
MFDLKELNLKFQNKRDLSFFIATTHRRQYRELSLAATMMVLTVRILIVMNRT